ncbi:DNA-directed RNA polymerase I subunit RPA12 [Chrysoperla carnea]|uniref:DNA-directed RNA polymerase I subunit RPA12 n=1 Tax=Chrysoperla carnea TaxID=189513 RepID=UPI001D07C1D7|nr:DNA-directed RNA polymerase I subunit RPA12 [Chrysoperla carnea]
MSTEENLDYVPGFCPLCGDILPLLKEKGGVKCYSCDHEWGPNVFSNIKADYVIHFNDVDALEAKIKDDSKKSKKKQNEGPVIERKCVKCGNGKMSYATLQLRSADEGQTVFYTCTKCGFKESENS